MPVNFIRQDYSAYLRRWEIIRDCYEGEMSVKFRREKYLPRPNPTDMGSENTARYNAYLTRAVFYNVTKRTLNGLVGLLFARDPIQAVPDDLLPVITNADGSGADIIQLAKLASRLVVGYGRAGIFVDYPTGDTPASKADVASGKAQPTIKIYEPWRVINWRTVFRDGQEILSLIVMEEQYTKSDDGFVVTFGKQWRVLRLAGVELVSDIQNPTADTTQIVKGGVYTVDVYRDNQQAGTRPYQTFTPTDHDGKTFDLIPFMFLGAETNKAPINDPPLYDLAALNIGHYRNSADYEESVYIVGQATPWFSGLTEQWVTSVLKDNIQLGSRGAIPLPVGADAGMLQASENGMVFEAMTHKEKQMVAIGANLTDTSKSPRTATETLIDDNNERSVLATAGDNVSDGFMFALNWCTRYTGTVPDSPGIMFVINTDFDLVRLTAQERQELVLEWQSGAISITELRQNLKRGGIATQELAEFKADVKANPPPAPVAPAAQQIPATGTKEPKLIPGAGAAQ